MADRLADADAGRDRLAAPVARLWPVLDDLVGIGDQLAMLAPMAGLPPWLRPDPFFLGRCLRASGESFDGANELLRELRPAWRSSSSTRAASTKFNAASSSMRCACAAISAATASLPLA